MKNRKLHFCDIQKLKANVLKNVVLLNCIASKAENLKLKWSFWVTSGLFRVMFRVFFGSFQNLKKKSVDFCI